jgi:GT2 family glycosyltransferase
MHTVGRDSRPPSNALPGQGAESRDFAPTMVEAVDLEAPLAGLAAARSPNGRLYQNAVVLARLHGEPLGLFSVPLDTNEVSARALAAALWEAFEEAIARHAQAHDCLRVDDLGPAALLKGLTAAGGRYGCEHPDPETLPPVTIVVPTCGRPAQLTKCLDSLRALRYPEFEVLVIDNRPGDPSTRTVVTAASAGEDRIRYRAELRPGSSVARNAGVRDARNEIVAFTDDDVVVDASWLEWLVRPFVQDPRVDVVTGLVLPARLDTPAQWWFEEYAGFAKGFARQGYDLDTDRADDLFLYPYWGGAFGSGNSMAFRRSALAAIGGFDPALGAGSPARGGADIEVFSHLILRGGRLVYEPRAICWHEHRHDEAALRRQISSYGVGFTAVLTKWLLRDPRVLFAMARGAAMLARRALSRGDARQGKRRSLPARFNRLELRGYLLGPALYLRSAWWARRRGLDTVLPAAAEAAPRWASRAHPKSEEAGFAPTWVTQVELDAQLSDVVAPPRPDGRPYARARTLVRLHQAPLGIVELPLDDGHASAERLVAAVRSELSGPLAAHLERDGLPPAELTPAGVALAGTPPCAAPGPSGEREPFVSVVVATRERVEALAACLERLLTLDYDRYEVIVVDNVPATDGTAELVSGLADPRVRYAVEPIPGASRARNTGADVARGDVVAFVDDDVLVDPYWLRGLVRGFTRDPEVACVTALVPSAELETEAQSMFDARVSWGAKCVPRLYDLGRHALDDPLYPYIPGAIGTGASFAVQRQAFSALGGFDEALGPGRPSRGGEDLDLFLRFLLNGRRIAYEPAALSWHVHRRAGGALRDQLFGYGCGLTAYAVKYLLSPRTALDVIRRVPRGLSRLRKLERHDGALAARPPRLVAVEAAGLVAGPWAYLLSRWRLARLGQSSRRGQPSDVR